MGSRGQPAAQDTRCGETFPAVSHGKGGVSSLGSELALGPLDFLLTGLPVGAAWEEKVPQGSVGRPGLLTVHPSSDHTGLSLPLLPYPAPVRRAESSGTPDVHSWALVCSRPQVDGRQAEIYLPWEVLAEPGEQLGWPERPGRVSGGRGLPSHASPLPGQALQPKMSLFTARRQDFLLLEERALTGAWRDWGELASTSPSESETHGHVSRH